MHPSEDFSHEYLADQKTSRYTMHHLWQCFSASSSALYYFCVVFIYFKITKFWQQNACGHDLCPLVTSHAAHFPTRLAILLSDTFGICNDQLEIICQPDNIWFHRSSLMLFLYFCSIQYSLQPARETSGVSEIFGNSSFYFYQIIFLLLILIASFRRT
jgi:hypothetical protein